jgi:hypothetical protein
LPTELAEAQVEFLEGKFDAARTVVEEFEPPITKGEAILQAVEEGLELVYQNRRLYDVARGQAPDSETTRDLYEEYLGAIEKVAFDLQVLERQLVYLDLNQYQQTLPLSDQLNHVESLSEELKTALDLDVTTIPVVWNGFAIDPLDSYIRATGERSHIYAVILPRTRSDSMRYSPLIGHELGHAVLDRHEDLESEFYVQVRDVARRTQSGLAHDTNNEVEDEAHFVRAWRDWFEELFCDACGVLTFGPSYVAALVWRLFDSNPYYIERHPEESMHPPPALRYKLVAELTEELFPVLDGAMSEYRTAFESHLADLQAVRPSDYDAYDYDELRRFVLHEVPSRVTHDLDALIEDIERGTPPADSSDRAHRLATNQYWLDSYPP